MRIAKYHVYNSVVLDAPPEEVWREIRDISKLLPIIFGEAGTRDFAWLDGGSPERIPSRYQVTLMPSNNTLLEEVVARSEEDRALTYVSHTGGMLEGYVATYRLRPITNEPGKTFLEWPRDFGVTPGSDPAQILAMMDGITAGHVAALKAHFARKSAA